MELVARGANIDVHSSNAAIITNPAWRLTWALGTLKNDNEEILIDHFYDRVLPPNETERKILEEMVYKEKEQLNSLALENYLLNLTGYQLKEKLIFQPTCTICGLESGYTGKGSKTVLPSTAKAKIDFRLVADQDPDEILELLRKHLDKHGFGDIEIVKISGKRAAKTDPNDKLVKTVLKVTERATGKPPQILITTPGTGPMYKLCKKYNIPAVGFGVGYYDSKIHAPNENIVIDDYIKGIKLVASVVNEFSLQ
ncbi:MAG: M20/M25/M40 family metallo-hydrolase [Bacillus sp. (in: Bacteria)]|nr:M20/M25/M40 family metallo-hydrolase [Bacillus sp. (in: firmicutes)]